MKSSAHGKEFQKLARALDRYQIWRVFADFCELSALAFANGIIADQQREERYLRIASAYEPAEFQTFPQMLAITIEALDISDGSELRDFLGDMFQQLELSNHWRGQYFTPPALARLMAELTIGDLDDLIAEKGFITVQEPAAGAGVTLIALAAAMLARGHNPQRALHVTAIDVDPTAAHMCYVQLSLLHIPALVYVGNTLTLAMQEVFATPAHHLGFWQSKLARTAALAGDSGPIDAPPHNPSGTLAEATSEPAPAQTRLFS